MVLARAEFLYVTIVQLLHSKRRDMQCFQPIVHPMLLLSAAHTSLLT